VQEKGHNNEHANKEMPGGVEVGVQVFHSHDAILAE
jgi:hypothetical protein